MKKIITAVLVLSLMAALTTASSGGAGTASDPLITKSYADGTYADSVVDAAADIINNRIDAILESIGREPSSYAGLDLRRAEDWTPMAAQVGSSVTLVMGSSFILTTGSATVDIASGEIIDVATGASVPSGSTLRQKSRYFCTEDTVATFKSVDGIAFLVEGRYAPGKGVTEAYPDYDDVVGLEWYTDPAAFVKDNGIYHDSGDASFRPQETITRAELVYALWVAFGRQASDYEPPFTDLTEDWYLPAVRWAAEHKITEGMSPTTFVPMGGVNREQLARMVFLCADLAGFDVSKRADLTVYSDWETINDWGADPISWATAEGIITGMDVGTVAPLDHATRAQIASVLMRYLAANLS